MNNGGLDPVNLALVTGMVATLCKIVTASFTMSQQQRFGLYLIVTIIAVAAWAISNGPVTSEWAFGLLASIAMVLSAAGGVSIGADKVTGGKTTAKGDDFSKL